MSDEAYQALGLAGRVAMVTGSASGIGRATAELLAARGARVAIADLNEAGAQEVAVGIRERGGTALGVPIDVTEATSVRQALTRVGDAWGSVEILHNNAALMTAHDRDRTVEDLEVDDFLRVLRVNLVGYMLCAKHVLPGMVAGHGGVIVNTASLAGVVSSLSRPMYGASKGGVISLTRSIATQYGRHGVRCVAISPGVVVTDHTSTRLPRHTIDAVRRHTLLGRAGSPSDIANLVAFLVSDAASYLTGVNIAVDGGLSAHLSTYADEVAASGPVVQSPTEVQAELTTQPAG